MQISDYIHDKILWQKWANDLWENTDLLDEECKHEWVKNEEGFWYCELCGKEGDPEEFRSLMEE